MFPMLVAIFSDNVGRSIPLYGANAPSKVGEINLIVNVTTFAILSGDITTTGQVRLPLPGRVMLHASLTSIFTGVLHSNNY